MNDLARLLSTAAACDYGQLARQARRNALLGAVMAVFVLTAYIAGVVALAIYLSEIAGPAAAALTIAIGALAFALILLAVIVAGNRRERERRQLRAQSLRSDSFVNLGLTALPALTRTRPLTTVAIAAAIAFLATAASTGGKK